MDKGDFKNALIDRAFNDMEEVEQLADTALDELSADNIEEAQRAIQDIHNTAAEWEDNEREN